MMRKIVFWAHLAVGLVAGVFIFLMSATGVLLTYEHKIIDIVAAQDRVEVLAGVSPLPLDLIAETAWDASPGVPRLMLSIKNRDDAPVTVYQLGYGSISLDPYTSDQIEVAGTKVEEWLHTLVEFHRWLALDGQSREVARAFTGAANLGFLFLAVTGLYLWFPKLLRWPFLRQHLFFIKNAPTPKARDYNWHHVLGFWCLIPLIAIMISGAVMSYPWANKAVYAAFGEDAPSRGGPSFLAGAALDDDATAPLPDPATWISLEQAFIMAKASDAGWTKINVLMTGGPNNPVASFLVNNGDGYLPEQRTTLVIDRQKGEIVSTTGYEDLTSGQKARMFMRFIHTGEQYGVIGSTIAGLVSLAACFMVYTGFALSYRRFFRPKRKKAA